MPERRRTSLRPVFLSSCFVPSRRRRRRRRSTSCELILVVSLLWMVVRGKAGEVAVKEKS